MLKHTSGRAGDSIDRVRDLMGQRFRAQAWTRENVHECLGDCDEHARIMVSEPDGVSLLVRCPLLSKDCQRGADYEAEISKLAAESVPRCVPKRFRREVENAADTLAVDGARRWPGTGFLYIFGPTGTGKSYAAAWRVFWDLRCRLEQVWDQRSKWTEVSGVVAEWLSAFAVCLERTNLYRAEDAPLLVLDDLGCEAASPANKAVLNELVSVRYNERRPTIITSNLDLPGLDHRYGSMRMYERIIQSNHVVDAGITNKRLEDGE